jgi:HEAT repeats/PBS lyase HEAT-like repeat
MFNHEIFAVSFGRSLELTRAGAPVEERKAALGAVYALTSNASAMLRVYQDMLTVDDVGIPDSLPFVPVIIERVRDHGVAEVAIAKGAAPTELLALIRGLASDPGTGGVQAIKARLRDARSTAIMVIPVRPEEADEVRGGQSVQQAFEAEEREQAVLRAAEPVTPEPFDFMEIEPARRIDLPAIANAIDLGFKRTSADRLARPVLPPAEAPAAPAAPAQAPAASAAPTGQPAAAPAGAGEAHVPGFRAAGERPVEPDAEPDAAGVLPTLGLPVGPPRTALSSALAQVAAEPYASNILDVLTELDLGIQEALAQGEVAAAVHALAAMIAWEPEAPAGTCRNSYAIVLQRVLTREHLMQIIPLLGAPRLGPEAIKVVQRGGAEAAVVLLERLEAASELRERRALVTALRGIPDGLDRVVHMLHRNQWFVVRNVAEAMGVQRVAEAVPELVTCLDHDDARVRRAAAIALARIGTPATVEPLQHVLKEGDRELRALIASSIGGHSSRALAMPLVAITEQESDLDVLRELYKALGRIGTPDAVQALAAAAEPGGRLLGRRPSAHRVAAVDGLRIAGGKAATAALQALAGDGDKAVRDLATRALEELRARAASLGS